MKTKVMMTAGLFALALLAGCEKEPLKRLL